jgi:uncharacterized protein
MQYQKLDNTYVIKLEKGEAVIDTLTKFCMSEKIANAEFSGIGAVKGLTCGYYELEEKKYYFTDYPDLVEVVSLTGNVFLKDDKPFIHMHGVFTDTKNQAFGGHISEMTVGVVLEVMLRPLNGNIKRTLDTCIGLALIDIKAN